MTEPAPKARRRWILIPWMLFIVAAIGWSAWWMIGAREIGKRMDAQAAVPASAGYAVSWSKRSISGYPFRFFVQLEGGRIDSLDRGWGLSAAKLDAEASALTPGVIVLVAPQGLTLSRPGKPPLAINGDVLRMSVSGLGKTPPRVAMEGRGVRLIPGPGDAVAFDAIDRLEARLTPGEGDKAGVFLRIDKATPSAASRLSTLTAGTTVTIGLQGTAAQASRLSGKGWPAIAANWMAGGGELQVEAGGLALGQDPLISLDPSKLRIDAGGYLDGSLRLAAGKAAEAMMALGEVSVLPPETAAVASGVAPAAVALGGGSARLTLKFHDGQTWIGPLPIGPAPNVFGHPPPAAD